MTRPMVSVVIPTLNAESLLGACLRSIKQQTYQNIEIIVVDGHSKDRTMEIALRYTSQVYAFGPDQSKGRVYGGPYQRNYGAERARGKYIYLVDADMEPTPRVIEAAVEKLEGTRADALIIPEEFHGTTFWAQCKWLEKRCYRGDDLMEAPRIISAEAWKAIGGVDATLGGVEDREMFRKIKEQGWRVERIRELVMNNEGRLTLLGSWRKKYLYGKSAMQYWQRETPLSFYQQFTLFKGAYMRNWRLLLSHPVLFFGFLFMRVGEYVAAGAGVLRSLFKRDLVNLSEH